MKNKIIVIHGARALSSKNPAMQKMIDFIYERFFNFRPEYLKENPWVKELQKKHEVLEVKWNGRVTFGNFEKVARRATKMMDDEMGTGFDFLTESVGTEIGMRAALRSQNKNVGMMVGICPVMKSRKIEGFDLVVLKSDDDIFARFSQKFLWPVGGWKKMKGRVKEVVLKGVRHDQFVPGHEVFWEGKKQTLMKVVERFLEK